MKIFKIWAVLIACFMPIENANAASKTIGILVFNGFLTSDVTAPLEVFGAAANQVKTNGYKVILISAHKSLKIKSEEGLNILADKSIYDPSELDVLIVPSAYNMEPLLSNKDLIQFIKRQNKPSTWFNSNCSGAFLLAKAQILDGKKATTWAGGEKELAKNHPKIKVQYDTNVVVDGQIITSNGGPVSYQAAFELLAKLSSPDFAKKISQQIQFDRLATAF